MFQALMDVIISRFKSDGEQKKFYFALTSSQRSALCFLENANNVRYWRKKCELKIERVSNQMYGTKRNLLKMMEFLRVEMKISAFEEYIEIKEV